MMRRLYHIAAAADWERAGERYLPPGWEQEGFIHLSWADQWRLTLQRYYRERSDLLLLEIDPEALGGDVRVESGFPHLYAPLEKSAVRHCTPLIGQYDLRVALVSQLHPDHLTEARAQGARLAVLPELPFQRWCPALPEPDPQDQDSSEQRRLLQQQLARESGLWLLGGLIESGRNTAYLWSPDGQPVLRYEKLHLPQESGFWETRHFSPGQDPPQVCDALGFPLGVQLCSDIQRPFGAMLLRAQGAGAILVPRASERATYPRWRRILQSIAQLSACYVLSVNRPEPELGVPLGGPSLAVDPCGEILVESTDPTVSVTLSHARVVAARAEYPGYLPLPAATYAAGWAELAR